MNNDLISRSALLSKKRTIKPPECNSCEYEHMEYVRVEDVQNAPTVDAEPVRHGRWIEIEEGEGGHLMECSVCKEWLFHNFDYVSNYCPNCGAKMTGGDADA